MKVEAILSGKGAGVVSVVPEDTIATVARVLAEKSIGAVVVSDGRGGLAGIITERDLVRALARFGAETLDHLVSELMTRNVVTANVGDSIDQVSERMTRGKFRHVPVVDGAKVIGMVSIGDVVKHRIEQIEAEASAMRDYIATA
ncbi:CBS domain-containing protein [Methylopila sp. M107]|uniref:CBS domain-containing protein n=1 Tax=Methylopila sp. M107 TaxID=1101190 RepID=UPI00036A57BC|nr:CBS domain-containing protein [Methylopila sp. M107]